MKSLDEATARRMVVEASDFGNVPAGEVEAVVRRGRRRRRTRRATHAVGIAVLLTVVAVGALALPDDSSDGPPIAAGGHESNEGSAGARPEDNSVPDPDLVDRLEPADAVARCAFGFSAETLRDRAFAFDGTVLSTRPQQDPKAPSPESDMNRVKFEVHEWFAGGTDPTATIWVAADLVAGDRLLVSGEPRWGGAPLDDAIAWLGCGGFTSAYSDRAAEFWRKATQRGAVHTSVCEEGVYGGLCEEEVFQPVG